MDQEQSAYEHSKLLKRLQSANSEMVLETIEELRASGKTTDVPVLLDLLLANNDTVVRSKIVALFSNLKDAQTIPYLISAIQEEKFSPVLKELVSTCWENGLDYSNYLSVFVDLLIVSDFMVAFEAYTVITNMTQTIDQAIIDTEIDRIDQAMKSVNSDKKSLMLDVIDFLPSIGR
jgi:hypothetical protein